MFFKNFAKFTGKDLCWISFLIKKETGTDVFLRILRGLKLIKRDSDMCILSTLQKF